MVTPSKIDALLMRRERLRELNAKWTPHKEQLKVIGALKSGIRCIMIRAGRRSGKTFTVKYIMSSIAITKERSTNSIITPSLKQGNKIYWKKRQLQEFVPRSWVKQERNDDLTLFLNNGSYIEVDGSENIDAHRGDEKDGVALDEFKDINPAFLPEVVEPMLLTTQGIVLVIGSPPEEPDSHFRDLEMHARESPNWAFFSWTAYDSPYCSKAWLDAKWEEMKARGEEDIFKREYLAEYTRGGKNSIIPMFSRKMHVRPPNTIHRYFHTIKDRTELYIVNDPGTSSTFASLLCAYHREAGQSLFLDEIYNKDKSLTHTEAIVTSLREKIQPFEPDINKWTIVYDDAAAWFGNELLFRHKISSHPANKAATEQEEGIALFKSLLLQKNAVIISELCEFLIQEIENYIMINGKYPKKNDHQIDNVRYYLNFAQVVLALVQKEDLKDNEDDLLIRTVDSLGLGLGWIQ